MNRSDLIHALAEQQQMSPRRAEQIVNTVFDAMADAMKTGDRVEIRDFASFMIKEYAGYTGRNPKTGEPITVQPKRLPFFKAGKELRERVSGE